MKAETMKIWRIVRTVVLLAPLAGCSHHVLAPINILPVPPQDAQWEGAAPDHIHLPLTAEGRAKLEEGLYYGLNPANKGRAAIEPDAKTAYKKLFDLLSSDATLADLSKPAFQGIFQGDRVDQVIDAREKERYKSPGPVAFRGAASGGRYWWIFYRDGNDHLTAVMPVRLQEFTKLVEKEK